MPQATSELQVLWGTSDEKALDQILPNFTISRGGIIRPKLNYVQTDKDLSAIDFLFQEWDYGYEPLAVCDSCNGTGDLHNAVGEYLGKCTACQ